MDIKNIINKKANKKELTNQEIEFFVNGYVNGTITDYQASALLMAIKINGMSNKETFALTNAMLNSGEILNFDNLGTVVDKHSTGGVSDTTTLALAPICAVCGVKMIKLSGRGLGFTGGTIDKIESFENFQVEISKQKAIELVNKNNACIMSANKNVAPADKKLYALRDSTSTVESLPLIASSIMSKKLATGAHCIVLDVKYGNGAFMKTKKEAKKLAELMCKIGQNAGKKMDYILDDMNQPLGYNIGNKLEAYEVIELLSGKQSRLSDVTIELASRCIALGLNIDNKKAKQMAVDAINSKQALQKFKTMITDQGGNTTLFDGLDITPTLTITATHNGKLKQINCCKLGEIVGTLGATRQTLTDPIDYNVGIKTFHKLGDKITKGDALFEVYAKTPSQAEQFKSQIHECYKY